MNAVDESPEVHELRDQLTRLRAENARLRTENRGLRCSLDAIVARVRSTAQFGPVELSAGTCVGPRRVRTEDVRASAGRPAAPSRGFP